MMNGLEELAGLLANIAIKNKTLHDDFLSVLRRD